MELSANTLHPFTLFSGPPGSGKTQRLLQEGFRLLQEKRLLAEQLWIVAPNSRQKGIIQRQLEQIGTSAGFLSVAGIRCTTPLALAMQTLRQVPQQWEYLQQRLWGRAFSPEAIKPACPPLRWPLYGVSLLTQSMVEGWLFYWLNTFGKAKLQQPWPNELLRFLGHHLVLSDSPQQWQKICYLPAIQGCQKQLRVSLETAYTDLHTLCAEQGFYKSAALYQLAIDALANLRAAEQRQLNVGLAALLIDALEGYNQEQLFFLAALGKRLNTVAITETEAWWPLNPGVKETSLSFKELLGGIPAYEPLQANMASPLPLAGAIAHWLKTQEPLEENQEGTLLTESPSPDLAEVTPFVRAMQWPNSNEEWTGLLKRGTQWLSNFTDGPDRRAGTILWLYPGKAQAKQARERLQQLLTKSLLPEKASQPVAQWLRTPHFRGLQASLEILEALSSFLQTTDPSETTADLTVRAPWLNRLPDSLALGLPYKNSLSAEIETAELPQALAVEVALLPARQQQALQFLWALLKQWQHKPIEADTIIYSLLQASLAPNNKRRISWLEDTSTTLAIGLWLQAVRKDQRLWLTAAENTNSLSAQISWLRFHLNRFVVSGTQDDADTLSQTAEQAYGKAAITIASLEDNPADYDRADLLIISGLEEADTLSVSKAMLEKALLQTLAPLDDSAPSASPRNVARWLLHCRQQVWFSCAPPIEEEALRSSHWLWSSWLDTWPLLVEKPVATAESNGTYPLETAEQAVSSALAIMVAPAEPLPSSSSVDPDLPVISVSPSSLETFLSCPKRYQYQYEWALPQPQVPARDDTTMPGLLLHAIWEAFNRQASHDTHTPEALLATANRILDRQAQHWSPLPEGWLSPRLQRYLLDLTALEHLDLSTRILQGLKDWLECNPAYFATPIRRVFSEWAPPDSATRLQLPVLETLLGKEAAQRINWRFRLDALIERPTLKASTGSAFDGFFELVDYKLFGASTMRSKKSTEEAKLHKALHWPETLSPDTGEPLSHAEAFPYSKRDERKIQLPLYGLLVDQWLSTQEEQPFTDEGKKELTRCSLEVIRPASNDVTPHSLVLDMPKVRDKQHTFLEGLSHWVLRPLLSSTERPAIPDSAQCAYCPYAPICHDQEAPQLRYAH